MSEPLESEETPPPALKKRVVRSLREQGVLRPERTVWRYAARAAAAVVLFAAGAMMGRASPPAPAAEGGGQYLLALHEDSTFAPNRPEAELVQEYGGWANDLAARGRLVLAEQLGWSMVLDASMGGAAGTQPPPSSGSLGAMSGFFLVRAVDREEAVALALTHPHLRYGGTIEVREVVR